MIEAIALVALLAAGIAAARKNSTPALPPSNAANSNSGNSQSNAIAGALGVVTAAAGAGAAIGDQIDKVLGGTGSGATGVVASVGGALGGAAIAAAALGLLGPAGWTIAAAVIVVAVLVYAITSIVTDINRLAYGQNGARNDYDKMWQQTHDKMFSAFRVNPKNVAMTDTQIERIVIPLCDGFMLWHNQAAYNDWMARGRAILGLNGSTNYDHAIFGRDRGYFVGDVNSPGGELLQPQILSHSSNSDFVSRYTPPTEVQTKSYYVRVFKNDGSNVGSGKSRDREARQP